MALQPKLTESLLDRGYSRRQIAKIAMGASAAIASKVSAQRQDFIGSWRRRTLLWRRIFLSSESYRIS